tara:strand:+ start:6122 stop:7033 length:912 start_codon:yes stop_codon:yes gene_type:complete
MLLSSAITTVLRRSGLSITNATFKDQAREYINMILSETLPEVPWWWLEKTTTFITTETFTISSVSGTFTAGETITGGTSSFTAVVDAYTAAATTITVRALTGVFTATETITGGSSGATATYASTARTRTYNPISGTVTAWHSFVDQSNNRTLDIVGADSFDAGDPDRDQTGDARSVLVSGVDAVTGYPSVDLWPLPPENDTIQVRYKMDIPEWTSSNDTSDLMALGITPRVLQSMLVYGAVSLYMEANGDDTGAQREAGNMSRVLEVAKKQNLEMQGNRQFNPIDSTSYNDALIRIDSSIVIA